MTYKKLSLCMIVKNEEKMLAECLQSVADVVDEMIIVDTGSTDKTIDIAKKYKAEIHTFDWNGDFSAARNESIKYASGNWILWMDADERLNPDSKEELRSIVNKAATQPEIYKVNIKNFQKGDYFYISDAHRLFSNHFNIEFSGRIHEQISPSLKKIGGREVATNIEIYHYGYNLDETEQQKKNARNLALLEKMVSEQPDYAYGYYTLAQNYAMSEKYEEAVKNFQKALDLRQLNKQMTASLLVTYAEVLMKMENFTAAVETINRSLKLEKDQTGAYYLLYKIALKQGNRVEARKWLKYLLDKNRLLRKSGKRGSTDVIIEDEKILQEIAKIDLKTKNLKDCIATCEEIIKLNQNNVFAHRTLLNCYMDQKSFDKAFNHFQHLKSDFTIKDVKFLEIIGTLLIKNHKHAEATVVFDLILTLDQNNQNALKKLVGLLAKTGHRKEAEELLIAFQQHLKGK